MLRHARKITRTVSFSSFDCALSPPLPYRGALARRGENLADRLQPSFAGYPVPVYAETFPCVEKRREGARCVVLLPSSGRHGSFEPMKRGLERKV